MLDTWRLDATAQAQAVREGHVTPGELLDLALARIRRLNPALNAVIALFEDVARTQIAVLDRDAPFAGVPILLKDAAQELEGTPYALGTPALKKAGYASPATTEVTRRLLEAGFVILGKTNVPELSSGFTTEPEAFGPTRNPWDTDRIAGGSSGGAASAVAAGMVALAHGCDATGSLRVPAAACGLATLRPSRGVMPSLPPADQPSDVWTDFVLARSVRDLGGVLDAIGDTDALARREARGLRVGVLRHDPFLGRAVDPACLAAVEGTRAALLAAGHSVADAYPPSYDGLFSRIGADLGVIVTASRGPQARWLEARLGRPLRTGDLAENTLRAAAAASEITAEVFEGATRRVQVEMDAALDWWHEFDILVSPVMLEPPWPIGLPDGAQHAGLFVWPSSFTGQPSMSLPLHHQDGLPVGVQLVGAPGADRTLLALATALERALPWAARWPAVAET